MRHSERRERNESTNKSNILHILTNNKTEKVEIHSQCSDNSIESLLKSICGAGKGDGIKLTNYRNEAVSLNVKNLVSNMPSQPYHLEIISCCPPLYTTLVSLEEKKSLQALNKRIHNVELKLQSLGQRILESSPNYLDLLDEHTKLLQSQTQGLHHSRRLERNFENVLKPRNLSQVSTSCSSCPYFKNIQKLQQCVFINENIAGHEAHLSNRQQTAKTHDQIHAAWTQYQSIQMNEVKRSIRQSMKLTSFNVWNFSDVELLHLVKTMFLDLQLTVNFCIPIFTLDNWLFAVYQNYNVVPFHNFTHAFCVVQMVFAVIHISKLCDIFDDLEILILLFAAICHDLDHPGLNNTFQVNARTYLAQRYNDQSPLENHHCALAFQLLEDEDKNILKHLTNKQFQKVREITIKCILATDMARHGEILNEFRSILHSIDIINEPAHKTMVMVVIIKACDISNEARPPQVSEVWLECLLEEFFQQSDLEKRKGLPYAPFMDRDKVTKSNSQCGFIKYVIIPLLRLLVQLFPALEEPLLKPVMNQLEFYNKQHLKSGNVEDKFKASLPNASKYPMRKISTGSIPSGKSSACVSRRLSLSVNDSFQGPINIPIRKTSTGSVPSRKSSTGSLVLALS